MNAYKLMPFINKCITVSVFGCISIGMVMLPGASAQAGIASSKHDLSGTTDTTTTTTEVCVFCHTPHGADISAAAPLWNKRMSTGTYQRYSALNTSSLDGKEAPVGSVSLACLSCHDGTQAMDVMINAPGSNGYNASGASFSGSGSVMQQYGGSAPIPNLSSDLRDDHPISIQYAGGGCTDTDGAGAGCGTLGDADFIQPYSDDINNVRIWWVDTQGTGVREKQDMQLYTRSDVTGNGGAIEPTVECGSCHDPHNAGSSPVDFLRVDNTGSAVCLACHVK